MHLCQQIPSLKVTLSECTCLLEYVCVCMCYLGSAKMMGGNSASPETCVYASIPVSTILAELKWGVNGIPIFCKTAGGGCVWEEKLQVRGIFPLCSIQNNLWLQRCILLTVMMWRGSCFLSAKVPCSTFGLLCGYYIISMICRVCDPHSVPYSFSRFIRRKHYRDLNVTLPKPFITLFAVSVLACALRSVSTLFFLNVWNIWPKNQKKIICAFF